MPNKNSSIQSYFTRAVMAELNERTPIRQGDRYPAGISFYLLVDSSDQIFVRLVHHKFLGVEPDLHEVAAWVRELREGRATRRMIIQRLIRKSGRASSFWRARCALAILGLMGRSRLVYAATRLVYPKFTSAMRLCR